MRTRTMMTCGCLLVCSTPRPTKPVWESLMVETSQEVSTCTSAFAHTLARALACSCPCPSCQSDLIINYKYMTLYYTSRCTGIQCRCTHLSNFWLRLSLTHLSLLFSLLFTSLLISSLLFRSSVDSVDESCTAPFLTRFLWPTYLYRVINHSHSRSIRSIHPIRQPFNQSICQSFISSTHFKYIRYIHPIHPFHTSDTYNTFILSVLSVPTLSQRKKMKRNQIKSNKKIIVYISGVVYCYYTSYCTQLSYTENKKTFDMPL